jgi:SNF2 family DNA or RNA helicase
MRPWNPAVENQATDRTHRIGQTKTVHVYYPIATRDEFPTVEQVLDKLLDEKRQLAEDVVVPSATLRVTEQELLQRVFAGVAVEETG